MIKLVRPLCVVVQEWLDFAEDFFTLCGNLDGDSSLSIKHMVLALGDFGLNQNEIDEAVAVFEQYVKGADAGSFDFQVYLDAAGTPPLTCGSSTCPLVYPFLCGSLASRVWFQPHVGNIFEKLRLVM